MNPTQPIKNARDTLLSQRPGTMPDVSGGILNYFKPLELSIVTKTTVNMQLVETSVTIQTSGMIQPKKQRLQMKDTGQRKWNVKTLWTLPVVELTPDDIVTIVNIVTGNTSYRVLAKEDWSEAGFVTYDLEEDYS